MQLLDNFSIFHQLFLGEIICEYIFKFRRQPEILELNLMNITEKRRLFLAMSILPPCIILDCESQSSGGSSLFATTYTHTHMHTLAVNQQQECVWHNADEALQTGKNCAWNRAKNCELNVCSHLDHIKFSHMSEVKSFSHVQLFATPWTVAYQTPPSMGFSKQEYWSVAISSSRGSSQPRDRTQVSCIASRCFTVWATREAWCSHLDHMKFKVKCWLNI